jgi:hypothetical protein
LPAIKAIWELGAIISVHDYQLSVVTHPSFKNFYKHIDLVISPPGSYPVFPELFHIPAHETKWRFIEFNEDQPPLQQPRVLSNDQYPEVEYALDKSLTDDSICCITHSSGTTGEPKIIKTSHRHAIALVKENIKIFEDKVYYFDGRL